MAVVLVRSERDRDSCEQATQRAFLASQAPDRVLEPRVETMIAKCSGSDSLTRIAVGLRDRRPRTAARLAREAAAREPESYAAWAVLSTTAPPAEARAAARRARELNPLSASDAGP